MNPPPSHSDPRRGFTLVELAVALTIVGLLLGGLLLPLSLQQDLRATRETATTMDTMIESLIGFALVHGRLPCPDTDLDGLENCAATVTDAANFPTSGLCTRTAGSCTGTACEGGFPFATLGLKAADSWGSRFRYRVSSDFLATSTVVYSGACGSGSVVSSSGIGLSANGDITVKTRGDDPATGSTRESKALINLATNLPAVIVSHGKNRHGGIGADGILAMPAPPPQNRDEAVNAVTGAIKIARTVPAATASGCDDDDEARPACEFDDIVAWLSPHVLFNRMLAAGRLP
ncbi:hypothetical protein B9N43_07885 [Denitratisoma sp. DHT3]|uniref:type II secretion system protein n=1 Tax=Denitratisoma sp. DHT3 TaxID=1981880 RepID=UPI001198BED1|nr:prepilin-type N-terminal cleavage/methylation domain-containing protein [Denitratisoma sp. DHT3]QDX81166.1 hypothetical protein B9N43_07885 [Denitratisoma sp. DHT3]